MSWINRAGVSLTALLLGAAAGCASVPEAGRSETQDLDARDGEVISPSLRIYKVIDDRQRWTIEAQSFTGEDARALEIYGRGPGVLLNDDIPPPERFAYEDVLVVGHPQQTDDQATQNVRELSAKFRLRSIEAAYERTVWEAADVSLALGGLFKLSNFSLHATERAAVVPAAFSVSETDTSLGLSANLLWQLSASFSAGPFLKVFYDPFSDVRGQQAGASVEYRVADIGLRYSLFRFRHSYDDEPSMVSVAPSGQQLGLSYYF